MVILSSNTCTTMSDSDGGKATSVGADGNNGDDSKSDDEIANASVGRGVTEEGDEGKNAWKNSEATAGDGAKRACDRTRNDSSSSSNENQAELAGEEGTDNKCRLYRSARVHCSSLALLSYHRNDKFFYLDVNANNVSLEKTGPIQNTLAGNPTKIDTANAETIDSSVIAAILTNKPDDSCVEVTDVSKYVSVLKSAPGAENIDETKTMVNLNLPLG